MLLQPGVAPFVLVGGVYHHVWKGRPFTFVLAATPLAFLIVGHALCHYWNNVYTYQLADRGLGYDGVLAILPLAALLARATRPLMHIARDVVAVAAAVALVVLPIGNERQQAEQTPKAVPQMYVAARILNSIVPPSARFATEFDIPDYLGTTGVPAPDDWLALESGRNTLNTFNIESSVAAATANVVYEIAAQPPDETADQLADAGATDVVTLSGFSAPKTCFFGPFPRNLAGLAFGDPLGIAETWAAPARRPDNSHETAQGHARVGCARARRARSGRIATDSGHPRHWMVTEMARHLERKGRPAL